MAPPSPPPASGEPPDAAFCRRRVFAAFLARLRSRSWSLPRAAGEPPSSSTCRSRLRRLSFRRCFRVPPSAARRRRRLRRLGFAPLPPSARLRRLPPRLFEAVVLALRLRASPPPPPRSTAVAAGAKFFLVSGPSSRSRKSSKKPASCLLGSKMPRPSRSQKSRQRILQAFDPCCLRRTFLTSSRWSASARAPFPAQSFCATAPVGDLRLRGGIGERDRVPERERQGDREATRDAALRHDGLADRVAASTRTRSTNASWSCPGRRTRSVEGPRGSRR
mmetsp:Transcript_5338/g.13303  ORF Transcript_5338/g.13303 Transcript_5338/m.13303 type:complete len:277 (-) Transcript_5338:244-1074(-)